MPTKPETIVKLKEAIGELDGLVIKPMFGEYGVWVDGKVVGGVHDDTLFLKASAGAKELTTGFDEAPPYPGAKPSIIVPETQWNESGWIQKVILASAASLPAPKPKKPKLS